MDALEQIIDDEIAMFTKAISGASKNILDDVFGEIEREDYDDTATIHGIIVATFEIVAKVQRERILELFDTDDDGRQYYSIIANALRGIHRKHEKSFLKNQIIGLLGLGEIHGSFLVHRDLALDMLKYGESVCEKITEFAKNLERGADIAGMYLDKKREQLYRDTDVVRYALLKTFEEDADLEGYYADLEKFTERGIEVFITSPIDLYLQLSWDSMTLVWKLLSFKLPLWKKGASAEVDVLQEFVHGIVSGAKIGGIASEMKEFGATVPKKYVDTKRKKWARILDIFKSKEDKTTFKRRFETGAIFRE